MSLGLLRWLLIIAAGYLLSSAYYGFTLRALVIESKRLEQVAPHQSHVPQIGPVIDATSGLATIEAGCLSDVQTAWE